MRAKMSDMVIMHHVVTCVRGEGQDHGGLGPRRDGYKTPTLFGPAMLDAART